MKLTKKQKNILDFIDGFVKSHDYSPTFREIMQALDYRSVSTVAKHIDNLVILGHLVKREGEARSLIVVHRGDGADDVSRWAELEREIAIREASSGDLAAAEVEILRHALEILRK